MDFVSFRFYVFLVIVLVAYHVLPLGIRWLVLLAGSLAYFCLATESPLALAVFAGIVCVSYVMGIVLESCRTHAGPNLFARGGGSSQPDASPAGGAPWTLPARRCLLAVAVLLVLAPLAAAKFALPGLESFFDLRHGIIVPLGLSFFTMQIVAYLVDVHKGRIHAQRNLPKYALFVSFFPQILQGPIPRYEQLQEQLVTGHAFDEKAFTKGFMLVIWGFFLKFMIADKSRIVVDAIFANPDAYRGYFVLVGGVLYSIQLYADFLACVTLAQGIALMFGIHLVDNFDHPYFSHNMKEFWSRWHISLSFWLRDYVYIPLGGSRKGRLRKHVNIVVTFLVSGIWHGTGPQFLVWGMMHAFYQVAGALTVNLRDTLVELLGIPRDSRTRERISCICTFLVVMLAWIMFRAESLSDGLFMLRSLFTSGNPWIFFDGSLLSLGLGGKEWVVLLGSIALHVQVSLWQERFCIRDHILAWPFCVRCAVYAVAVLTIMALGTYGYGYNAADFIYRGF